MKGQRIDRHWGWEIGFASSRLLYITKGSTFKGSAKVVYCLEGMANLTIFGDNTEIVLLVPNYYHLTDYDFEIKAKEDTMVIEVENTRNES